MELGFRTVVGRRRRRRRTVAGGGDGGGAGGGVGGRRRDAGQRQEGTGTRHGVARPQRRRRAGRRRRRAGAPLLLLLLFVLHLDVVLVQHVHLRVNVDVFFFVVLDADDAVADVVLLVIDVVATTSSGDVSHFLVVGRLKRFKGIVKGVSRVFSRDLIRGFPTRTQGSCRVSSAISRVLKRIKRCFQGCFQGHFQGF